MLKWVLGSIYIIFTTFYECNKVAFFACEYFLKGLYDFHTATLLFYEDNNYGESDRQNFYRTALVEL